MNSKRIDSLMTDLYHGRVDRRTFVKRALALGLSGSAAAALLQACGPAPTPPPTVTPASAKAAPTPVPPTPTPMPKVIDVLTFSHLAEIVNYVQPFFEKDTGIKMNVEQVVSADHRNKIISTHRTGSSDWDILPFWATVVSEVAHNGWLVDLKDRILEEFGGRMNDLTGGWSVFNSARYKDGIYAVPVSVGGPGLMWNKSLLQEAGLDAERPRSWYSTPWSIREWVEYCKACTFKKDGVQYYGFLENWGDQFNYVFTAYIQMFGGQILDLSKNPPWGEPTLNQEPGVEALQFMVDLLHTHKCIDPASLSANWCMDIMPPFLQGRVAFISSWFFIYDVANAPGDSKIVGQVGVAPNPAALTTATSDGSEYHGISAYGPNSVDHAWELLKYMASYRMQFDTAVKFKWGTIWESLVKHPDVMKEKAYMWVRLEQWKHPHEMWFTPDYNAWVDIVRAEGHKALRLEKKPKQALDDAAQQIKALRASY